MKTSEEILGNFGIGVNIEFGKYKFLYETLKNMVEYTQKESTEIAFKEGQSNPKIKQLEWEYLKSYYRSNSSIYKYAIIHANDFKTDVGLYSLLINGEFLNYYAELNEAKQFAQADFERRIKECLITE